MHVRLTVTLLLAFVLAPAGAAFGAGASGQNGNMSGCPQGYLMVDRSPDPGGAPPSYLPGDRMTTSGYVVETEKAAGPVTVRWGSTDGPAMAQGAIDSAGHFKGLSFSVPAGAARGTGVIYLEALDRSGQAMPGFPLALRIHVGPPVVPAREPATTLGSAPRPKRSERPRAKHAPAPAPNRPTSAQPAVDRPAPQANAQTRAPVRPEAKRAHDQAPAASGRARRPPARLSHRAPARLNSRGDRTSSPRPRLVRIRPAADSQFPLELLLALAFSSVAGLAAVGVWARRRHPGDPAMQVAASPGPAPTEPSADARKDRMVEAELQEIIAEERARRLSRDEHAGSSLR